MSLLGVLVIALLVAMYLLFTPARLTSIVNKVSKNYVTCQADFGQVDLTLFKTFPYVGLEVHDVVLVNPTDFAPSDTLAQLNSCTVAINVRDYLHDGSIVVKELLIDGVKGHLAVASDGRTNYDILSLESEEPSQEDTASSSVSVDLSKLEIAHVACSYDDYQSGLHAALDNLDLGAKGALRQGDADGRVEAKVDRLAFHMNDSVGKESLAALLKNVELDLDAKGNLDQKIDGNLSLVAKTGDIRLDGEDYINDYLKSHGRHLISIKAPFSYASEELKIGQSTLDVGQFAMNLEGLVSMPAEGDMQTQIAFEAEDWNVGALVASLPYEYASWSEGMELEAVAAAKGSIDFSTDSTYPSAIKADVNLSKAKWGYKEYLPYTFDFPYADLSVLISLTDAPSSLDIHRFEAKTGRNDLKGKVRIDDLTDQFLVDANISGAMQLHDVLNLVYYPEPLPMKLEGDARLRNVHLKTNLAQLEEVALSQMKVSGLLDISHLDVDYDSILVDADHLSMSVSIPAKQHTQNFSEMLSINDIKGSLHMAMPSMGLDAHLSQSDLNVSISDIMDEQLPFSLYTRFNAQSLVAQYDGMPVSASNPNGVFEYVPSVADPAKEHYSVALNTRSVNAKLNDTTVVDLGTLHVEGTADYDSTRNNVLKQWSPNIDIQVGRGMVQSSGLLYTLQLPDFKCNYQPERCQITDSKLIYGRSEIDFTGDVEGLEDWLSSEGMLKGNLNLTSNYTNVDELMELFSGAGTDPDTLQQMMAEDNVKPEACPFIVPKDVLINLNIDIQEALAFDNELEELAGNVKIYDGTAVLQAVSFVCEAGKMQVDALYQSPRPNKLYVGLDFHLIDLKIDELIKMIPMVDTLVPMLAYFKGDADFHMVASTNLYPDYTPMIPKMRGSVAIKAKDLVMIDNETFDKIAALMRFKRQTENKFDSLDVEMTLFKDEVELYPSMISIDKYSVCVAGSHLLDPKRQDNDYHLEIIESPLPVRLAVDVKGLSPFSIKLGKVQYADMYRPSKQNKTEQQAIELKRLISSTLESKVRESTKNMKRPSGED